MSFLESLPVAFLKLVCNYCKLCPLPGECNHDEGQGVVITSAGRELHQLSGYWSKKSKSPRSFRADFIKDSVIHYQSLHFDFLPSNVSRNLSATFIRSCLSVNGLWIYKIKRWVNQLFVII